MERIIKFIPNLPKTPYRNGKPEGVVFHTTGIMDKTNDSVERNIKVFSSEYVQRSKSFVHGFVDDISYWQSADYNYKAWGAGYAANERYIHIELCDTKDKVKFQKAYDNAIKVIVEVLKQYGLKPYRKKTLWTHYEVSKALGGTSHTDPVPLFNYHKISLDQFYKDVENAFYSKEEVKSVTVTKGTYRIKTGTFPNARALADAVVKIKADFGLLVYEAADSTSFNPYFRIYTGTFDTKEVAEEVQAKIKNKYGWTTYLLNETKN